MPYIKQDRRIWKAFAPNNIPESPGELNYIFTEVIKEYMKVKGLSYQIINDVLGALDGCSKEFYRRVAAPYEDKKIAENGDVYP